LGVNNLGAGRTTGMPRKNNRSRKEWFFLWEEYKIRAALFYASEPEKIRSLEYDGKLLWDLKEAYKETRWVEEPPIVDLGESGYLETIFDLAIAHLKMKTGEEPSIEDFKNELITTFRTGMGARYYAVRLFPPQSADDLSKLFRRKVSQWIRQNPEYREFVKKNRRWIIPAEPYQFDKVKEYGEVFDFIFPLIKKTGEGKITQKVADEFFRKFYPKIAEKLSDENLSANEYDRLDPKKEFIRRKMSKSYHQALLIIRNVANGFFPWEEKEKTPKSHHAARRRKILLRPSSGKKPFKKMF
jgi:hypothetical protein